MGNMKPKFGKMEGVMIVVVRYWVKDTHEWKYKEKKE